MERALRIIVLLFALLNIQFTIASNRTDILEAYVQGDMARWEQVMKSMQNQASLNDSILLELINYEYGFIAWCLGNNDDERAEDALKIAEKHVETLLTKQVHLSYAHAYMSAFYGYRIGLNVLKAPFIGPKSIASANLAISLDKSNPYGYLQLGNSEYYMPPIFGGSKSKALEYFLTALSKMEDSVQSHGFDWNYLSLLAMIGQTYENLNNLPQAKNYYEKALKIAPEFDWVKNDLYPELLKKF